MNHVRILEIKQSVFANNDAQAQALRQELRERGVSRQSHVRPGSGKTTTLTRLRETVRNIQER